MFKQVKHLIPAENIFMDGIQVKQALPTHSVPDVDPFLLLHHGTFKFRNTAPARQQGIGPHPHRGFSPVTFVIDGEVRHQDSRGNDQIAKMGEVQWMHAGAGIIHSERPSQNLIEQKGKQEIIQLWINSPADKKMQQPSYQHSNENEIVQFNSSDKKINNKLIAGSYEGRTGLIKTESELLIIWSVAENGGNQSYQLPNDHNAMIYIIKGTIKLRGYGVIEERQLAVFSEGGDSIELSAVSNAQYLILAGKPLKEKIVQSGPYVMNSQTQILEAMRDYQMGKMGILIEND